MTNFRKMMMDVIKGLPMDFVPFAPRLDTWYKSNALRGTLPVKYKNASLIEIIDDLDIGFNTMIPDFLDTGDENDIIHRGLGFSASNTSDAYIIKFHNVGIETEENKGILKVTYITPYGDLETITKLDDEMKSQGITIAAKVKKAVQSVKEFKAAEYLFRNAEILPDYERFLLFQERVGNRGMATCLGGQRESGIRLMNMELMDYDKAIYAQVDYPDEFDTLCETLDLFLDRCFKTAIDSPAELITVGAHFDATLTPPPFFTKYTLPRLRKYGEIIHNKQKFMASHTDSENSGLIGFYIEGGIDVADSVCTRPLVMNTYREIKAITKNRITLFGLIPSICVLENSMCDAEFDRFIDNLFSEIQEDGGRNIILAIADTTPPDAKFERVERIARLARELKPV